MEMREETTGPLYNMWSRFYDQTFGAFVIERQRRAVEQIPTRPGDKILDLGVGTGMTIKYFPRNVRIFGVDLSEGMLAKAQRKCRANDYNHVSLVQGNAMRPPFAENSFDHALICHTISVVSDPSCLLRWVSKLVKPGGHIVMLNHFRSTQPVMGWLERVTNPFWVKVGWRSDVALEDALRNANLHVSYQFKVGIVDLWQIVVMHQDKQPPHQSPEVRQAAQQSESQPPLQPLAGLLGT